MAKRQSRTAAEMGPVIEKYLRSNQSQKAFCANHGLSFSVFQYWYKKLGNTKAKDVQSFQEVKVHVAEKRTNPIIVRYPSGIEVHTPVG